MNIEKLIYDIERYLDYKKARHEYSQIEDEIEYLLKDYKTTKQVLNSYIRKRDIEEEIEKLKKEIMEKRKIATITSNRVEARLLNDQINELCKAIEVLEELLGE